MKICDVQIADCYLKISAGVMASTEKMIFSICYAQFTDSNSNMLSLYSLCCCRSGFYDFLTMA